MKVQSFFDPRTSTLSYLAFDEVECVGVVIDSVLDFDAASGRTWTESSDTIARFADSHGLTIPFVLDTHAHADHFSGMSYFKQRFGSRTVIGAEITHVQRAFREIFNLGDALPTDARQFDLLLGDGESLDVGPFEVAALHTPGHTAACMSYHIEDCLFVGDTLFQPDYGTARCDFPGGSAEQLYHSISYLFDTMPADTRVFTCHDYQPGGRELASDSTIAEQRRSNIQLSDSTSLAEFVEMREARDATLSMPVLILPSIQVNLRAGEFPDPEANGLCYLKLPINAFGVSPEGEVR